MKCFLSKVKTHPPPPNKWSALFFNSPFTCFVLFFKSRDLENLNARDESPEESVLAIVTEASIAIEPMNYSVSLL